MRPLADIRPLIDEVFTDPAVSDRGACVSLLDGPRFAPTVRRWLVGPVFAGGTATLDDWGSVDFAVCDSVTG